MKNWKDLTAKNEEQSESGGPDAEGTIAVAIPLGRFSGGVAFVASTTTTGRGATLAPRSCIKDDVSRRLGETPATKKVAFSNYKQYNFPCDTMTKTYDYDPAKRPFRPIRWSCARADQAKWHVQLARIIANDLFREVLSGPDGLIFAVQKRIFTMHY
jgi:hypothetical protein